MLKKLLKAALHLLEAVIVYSLYAIIWLLPIDFASAFFGKLLRFIGPLTPRNNVAKKNIKLCFPKLTEDEINKIAKDSWENLGRIVGEAPHLCSLSPKESNRRFKVDEVFKNVQKPCFFLSGHIGNFEAPCKLSIDYDLDLNLVYRPANNKLINWMIRFLREKNGNRLIPKGKPGLKHIISLIKQGKSIGLLIDQKMNDGIDTKFFGHTVKTTPMPANLALKYDIPIYMCFVRRINGAHFKVEAEVIDTKNFSDKNSLTQHINDILEKWVKEEPSQWFWIHNRFK